MAKSTRLRFISARSLKTLIKAVESLPFKVEIKGGIQKESGKWLVFFVLPEDPMLDFNSLELKS